MVGNKHNFLGWSRFFAAVCIRLYPVGFASRVLRVRRSLLKHKQKAPQALQCNVFLPVLSTEFALRASCAGEACFAGQATYAGLF